MSRNTVARLLAAAEPPKYVRRPAGSQVDGFAQAIAAMLVTCATSAGISLVCVEPEGASQDERPLYAAMTVRHSAGDGTP